MTDSSPRPDAAHDDKGRSWRKALIPVVIIAAAVILVVFFGGREQVAALRDWIGSLGPWAPTVFVALFVAASVLALPGIALTVIAGIIFGSVLGVILVIIGSTLGAALAFLVSRYFMRDAVERLMKANDKFDRLNALIQEHGPMVIIFVRILPIFPYNVVNYGFGLSRIPFRTYLFWSWLSMTPTTIVYVVGTDALVMSLIKGSISWGLVAVFVVSSVILLLVIRFMRKKLSHAESTADRRRK